MKSPKRTYPASWPTMGSYFRSVASVGLLRRQIGRMGLGLYVFDTCRQFIRTVPVLPRDENKPDDVDTEAEEHVADETRYRDVAMGARRSGARAEEESVGWQTRMAVA